MTSIVNYFKQDDVEYCAQALRQKTAEQDLAPIATPHGRVYYYEVYNYGVQNSTVQSTEYKIVE